jgi:hypothetical protein
LTPGRTKLERHVASAMRADDPVAALRAAASDPELSAEHRRWLERADPDGVRMQALLVARLRFERLLRGSDEAEFLFEHDPERFAKLFRAYHREVAMDAFFPEAEGRAFEAWRRAR